MDRNTHYCTLVHSGSLRTHTVYMCSSALTPSSARSALAGPWDRLGHPDTAYHKSASHSLKHGLADDFKYILEWAQLFVLRSLIYLYSLYSLWLMLLGTTGSGQQLFVLQALIYLYSFQVMIRKIMNVYKCIFLLIQRLQQNSLCLVKFHLVEISQHEATAGFALDGL